MTGISTIPILDLIIPVQYRYVSAHSLQFQTTAIQFVRINLFIILSYRDNLTQVILDCVGPSLFTSLHGLQSWSDSLSM